MRSLTSWRMIVRPLGTGLVLCILGLLGAVGLPTLAHAQSADPPGRVARLSEFDGTVTYAPAGTSDWRYANRNRPLTTGDAVWVDRNSRAEMHVGGTAVRMGASTSLALSAVTDQNVQLNVTQGTVGVRLRSFDANQPYEIDTPNLAFVPAQAGEYRVDVDPNGVTTVSVWRGAGTAYGQGASVPLQQGQRVAFVGQNLAQQQTGPLVADVFDQWTRERDAREDASVSARYVPRDMTGFESLDDYGSWQETPTYGAVWVPSNVPSGWAPYRTGHWVWVDPWGWTWVDDAPWGFAPYHYGRWAYVDARWCWVPGPVAVRPVYAPALVGWVGGNSGGNQWGVTFAAGGVGLAWFALGPHDAYRPAYHASSSYVTNINRSTIVRTTNITNNVNNINVNNVYSNQHVRGAVSTMPAQAFVQGRAVGAPVALAAPRAGQGWRVGNTPGVAPVQQSVIGNSRPAPSAPPAGVFNRQVLATRAPVARSVASRELTSNLHAVPNAGGAPLALGQSGQQVRNLGAGGQGQGRIAPRVTVVGTHGPVGAPIGTNGANGASPAQPALGPTGALGATPAHGGLPATGATSPMHGAPGVPGVPGQPGVPGAPGHTGVPGQPGVPGVPGVPAAPGAPGYPGYATYPGQGQGNYQNRPGQPAAPSQPAQSGVPHPPQPNGVNGVNGAYDRGMQGGPGGRGGQPQQGGAAQAVPQPGHEAAQREMENRRQSSQTQPAPQRAQPDATEPERRPQQWQSQSRQPPQQPFQTQPMQQHQQPQAERTQPQPQHQPQPQSQHQSQHQSQPQSPQPQAERAQPRADSQPQPQRPQPQAERPQPRPESPPAPRQQVQPERPQAQPHPQSPHPQDRPQPAQRESKPEGRASAEHRSPRPDEHPHG
ncbi:Putative prolin-rich exported protein [Pandoraea captiosa]|uniref:Prolin-rich exported protein n=1 Tax=Pandoraea captiosa TaxID=2508302 RepID=A0A5E5A1L0_9BURK|nr:DUF6600 domain-containing protein [Pandoraea captiosa]VVE66425.1 Putative prolin-rich exported protein [Pandoraea captiosa]